MKFTRNGMLSLLFVILFTTALSGVNYWGTELRQQAVTNWLGKASYETQRITDISLNWLSLFYTQLRGMAALLYGSESVTESEFLNALEMIEGVEVETVIPLSTVAYAEYRTTRQDDTKVDPNDGSLPITLSSDRQGPLAIGANLMDHPAIRTTIDLALDYAGKVVMGPTFRDEQDQILVTLVIKAQNDRKPGFLLSVINISELIDDLTTLHIPIGLNLRISEEREESDEQHESIVFGSIVAPQDTIKTFRIPIESGHAHWVYSWDILPNYQNGAATLSGTVVQVGGSMLVFVIFTAIATLAFQNMRINKLVIRRTAELAESNLALHEEIGERKTAEEKLQNAYAELKSAHSQLIQSEKMAGIGVLAAGVAHEINTPIQFIGDNTQFVSDSVNSLFKMAKLCKDEAASDDDAESKIQKITEVIHEADIDFLIEEIPQALEQTFEGVDRVSVIVNAMKGFAHMGPETMSLEDINKAIENTIVISKNEWKYVAEMKTELDATLPLVECIIGSIKQVVLNLIVNAAHAIKDKIAAGSDSTGCITVTTYHDADRVFITVGDTGKGIPDEVGDKVFDHFFTTKDVGRGTGQGLSIAYQTIVDKHMGKIWFETEIDKGTTFTIALPIKNKLNKTVGSDN